ncbi:MAG: methionyl-tRNA formyltransferase, partial [Mycobacterium sp.]
PNPGAWTLIGDLRIKLGPVQIDGSPEFPSPPKPSAPGDIHIDRKSVWIGTGSEPVRLGQIQPPGKKFMNAIDWARGARLDSAARAT